MRSTEALVIYPVFSSGKTWNFGFFTLESDFSITASEFLATQSLNAAETQWRAPRRSKDHTVNTWLPNRADTGDWPQTSSPLVYPKMTVRSSAAAAHSEGCRHRAESTACPQAAFLRPGLCQIKTSASSVFALRSTSTPGEDRKCVLPLHFGNRNRLNFSTWEANLIELLCTEWGQLEWKLHMRISRSSRQGITIRGRPGLLNHFLKEP